MIRSTSTQALYSPLPLDFYRNASCYQRALSHVFPGSWQFLAGPECNPSAGEVVPIELLKGSLEEPLVIACDHEGKESVFSNVCTHRGNLLVEKAGSYRQLVCRYHGRCFGLEGHCLRQPGLNLIEGFPDTSDHLRRPEVGVWSGLRFVRLSEGPSFEEWISPVVERTSFLPWHSLHFLPQFSRDYEVKAHWALYCDNFLEGLHIPFIHPGLREALDLEAYPILIYPWGSLQIGISRPGEVSFELPPSHPDQGNHIYAFYFWLFPNLMVNVYPWGLSLNIVEPLGPQKTRIRYMTYGFEGATGGPDTHGLHDTEMEDDSIVEQVQQGTSALLYHPGRLVPEWEKAVVHFHHLLVKALED